MAIFGRLNRKRLLKNANRATLYAECRIYNREMLNKRYGLYAKNEKHLLSLLLEKIGRRALAEIDGFYALAYIKGCKVLLARDILGVMPLWFGIRNGLVFASQKDALENIGIEPSELNPRKLLIFDARKNSIEFVKRSFFRIRPEIKADKKDIVKRLSALLECAIKKRIPKKRFGLLFSGGLDSSIIALLLKRLGCRFTCYCAAFDCPTLKEAEDLSWSKEVAKALNIKLKIIKVGEKNIEDYLKKIISLLGEPDVVKTGVALPLFVASKQARKDGCKVVFSGLGSEEIFAGYERHKKARNINKECISGLLNMYKRDLYRDYMTASYNGLELRLPFLDKQLVSYALRIPSRYKISNGMTKAILRDVALKLGLDKRFAQRKKRAAQYGSNFHKALRRLAKRHGNSIRNYLERFISK